MTDLYPSSAQAIDWQRRFGGLARLYGEAGLERLRLAQVCVVGIGGVGSWVAEALARSAVGRLTLVDPDHVAESNINRQAHALEDTLGQAKTQAMAARIGAINPLCAVRQVEEFVSADNAAELLPEGCDYLVDAIDNTRAKTALILACRQRGLPLVCIGGAGGRTDPGRVRLADLARTEQDPLLAKVRSRLRREHGYPRGDKARFGIDCVYSDQPLRYPATDGGVCYERPEDKQLHGLNCAGYGSSMAVTASFGLMASARVIDRLALGG